jgi:photosystem II stability/assembly factor-like uncharacterized protein
LLLVLLVIAGAPRAVAHFPHDVVSDLAVSPAFSNDRTAFAIVRGNLLGSTDGGRRWRRLSRGLGLSTPTSIQVSPIFAQDQTLFAGSPTGVYRSRDAGLNWRSCSRGLHELDIARLVISPRFATLPVVLAVTSQGSVYRTVDACEHWTVVLPVGSNVTVLDWAPGMLVAGTASGQLQRSTDSGGTWSPNGEIPGSSKIAAIAAVRGPSADDAIPGHARDHTVFVGTDDGLFRLAPGSPFARLTGGIPDEPITSLASLEENGSVVLLAATRHRAIFRSDDRGATWRHFGGGLKTDRQADWARMPQFSRMTVSDDGTVLLGGFSGVFRSTDHGRSWEELDTLTNQVIVGLDVSPATDDGYTIGVTTYGGGVYSKSAADSAWRVNNRGLPYGRMGTIAYSPDFARDHTALTGTYHSILRSVDGGASWKKVPVQYEDDPRARVDCGREKTARLQPRHYKFQMALGFAFSPAFAKDRTVFAAYRPEGLVRSVDGGASFSKIWHGCGDQVSSLVISRDYPGDRTLFASLNDGIYRSLDAGRSWKRAGNDRRFHKASLAISPRFGSDRTLYASGSSGLWRSRDAGETWQQLKIDGEYRAVALGGLAVSPFPAEPLELLVQSVGGPLYRCRDYGDRFEARPVEAPAEFSQMREFLRDRTPLLAFSPNYPSDGTLYAASMDRVFTSTDRGLSWAEVPRGTPPKGLYWPTPKPPR